jgi:hypothetical protein
VPSAAGVAAVVAWLLLGASVATIAYASFSRNFLDSMPFEVAFFMGAEVCAVIAFGTGTVSLVRAGLSRQAIAGTGSGLLLLALGSLVAVAVISGV